MDFSLTLGFLNFFTLIVLGIYLFINLKNRNQENIGKQISQELNQSQLQFLSQILGKLNELGSEQSREISSNLIKLEQRFGQIQLQIQESLNDGQSKSQLVIQERLQQGIIHLSELNKNELSKLQETTRSGLEYLSKTNQDRLNQINQDIQKRLDDNFQQHLKSFEEVSKSVGQVQGLAQRMIDSTTSIDKLNTIFGRTSSKSFGDFGEQYLESLLRENLHPNTWQKQVTVTGSSEKIDFVINIEDKKIGIDCKSPFTKYQDYLEAQPDQKKSAKQEFLRSILFMAKEISRKYGKNNFVDYLLIYLPSDSMYSEVAGDIQLVSELQKLNVSPISPVTIFPLILLIKTYQFKDHINKNAEQIILGLTKIKENVRSFQEEFRKLGDKIRQAQQNYDSAEKSLVTVEKTVDRLESSEEPEKTEALI